ncbi:MAG: putative Ig domain-containing protein [Akkermansiaceae bacterium]|nr:putative Ig domain-containing protein [Akkermansiaceae bacterium]
MRLSQSIIASTLLLLGFVPGLLAQTYTLAPAAFDSGGGRFTSSNYAADLSNMAGGGASSQNYNVRSGFVGQLFDVDFIPPLNLLAEGDGETLMGQLASPSNTTEFTLIEPVAGLTITSEGHYSFDPSAESYDELNAGQTYQAIANWKALDENDFEINGEILISVTGVNDRPTISGTPLKTIAKGSVYSFQAVGADVDVNTILTYSMTQDSDLPSWLSLNANTGILSGTPLNNDAGSTVTNIVISVSDGSLSASLEAFDIAVIKTQNLTLKEGWNLVSFYVEADDMATATVLAPIQDKLLQIKNLTQTYDPTIPANFSFLNNLSTLSVKDGYWLKVSEDVNLDVEGPVPSGASINVKSGWNLVGYPRLNGEGVASELTSLGSTVVQMKSLENSYDPSNPSFLNTLSTMAPGSGYWLKVTQDGTWEVGDGGPSLALVKSRINHSPEEKAGPEWGEVVVSPNLGATVLAKVSIQGKPVAKGGVVGVFFGSELRGIQNVFLENGNSYVTLNVNLNGAEEVSYRVWNLDDQNEYLVRGTMLLELGGMYGNPELVELNAVEVVEKSLQVFDVTREPFGFSFNTTVGRSYTVEATGDLQAWKAVELFQGSGGEVRFTAKPTSSGEAQFFRVFVE